ncbi:bifunctional hydroxymethylpyrimidine kinase/phosphomethylpyrimidine kinase [Geomonas sp. RF6]|uniref:bifunctional hydroxymethylpyrimidine kinase/phosphomethylpyrimidine kinase n=1 Tax=Geomonas sp. RF6 TaxID=2897342 RepID=UPI001E38312D|nr:bifunctional hydroxymethylpyrimidine kinase/phosphomethylpyrimidine kinase [Geomonas sp. RF6]UFS72678.1 bifunctional hydroxymethylpyrimidine kinase/phosphomethylpyrimidine kinase [Geomonas sp. RF6]
MDRHERSLKLVVDHSSTERRVCGLYLITDDGDRLLERVREALSGGVKIVQYRDKIRDYSDRVALGSELKWLCRQYGATFIVNDHVQLALELDADGVHLGQDDGDAVAARRMLGDKRIIGVSTHNLEEALAAQEAGADYVGLGAIFPTGSKDVPRTVGPQMVAQVKAQLRIPVVAIGGICRDNAGAVIDAGADAVAVISAILGAREPALAATEICLLFNRTAPFPRGKVLTVAGSDSCGGAGIQADLKTITLLGSYGASVITALTAQNTKGVSAIHAPPASFVAQQLEAVLTDLQIDVVKVGMLFSADIALALAQALQSYQLRMLVLDPVMTAKGGTELLAKVALNSMKQRLIPACYLFTPNVPEAERITGMEIYDEEGMERATRKLHLMGARNVLLKGGHLTGGTVTDILFDGTTYHRFSAPRTLTRNSHGTGCTLASAISAYLAQGEPLPVAVQKGKKFVTAALRLAQPLGKGHGPVNHFLAAREQAGQSIENQE